MCVYDGFLGGLKCLAIDVGLGMGAVLLLVFGLWVLSAIGSTK